MLRALAVTSLLLALMVSTRAEEWRGGSSGTIRVRFEETRQSGELVGCNLSFDQVVKDEIYRRGAPIVVHGLLTLLRAGPRDVGFFLKMSGEDVLNLTPFESTPFSPTLAYVSAGAYSSARRQTAEAPCDGPGYCAIFKGLEDFKGLLTIALSSQFTAAVQRRAGGTDLSFAVNLAAPDEVVSPATRPFAACAEKVLGGME